MKITFKDHANLTEITSDDGISMLEDLNVIRIDISAKVGEPVKALMDCYLTEASIDVLPACVTVFYDKSRITDSQRAAISAILKAKDHD